MEIKLADEVRFTGGYILEYSQEQIRKFEIELVKKTYVWGIFSIRNKKHFIIQHNGGLPKGYFESKVAQGIFEDLDLRKLDNQRKYMYATKDQLISLEKRQDDEVKNETILIDDIGEKLDSEVIADEIQNDTFDTGEVVDTLETESLSIKKEDTPIIDSIFNEDEAVTNLLTADDITNNLLESNSKVNVVSVGLNKFELLLMQINKSFCINTVNGELQFGRSGDYLVYDTTNKSLYIGQHELFRKFLTSPE